ncbi:MAG TPA: haloacid dehalogenase-like hydrolase [Blastocatellia bacterium]|nr:haloacid dehalogenase-like hydrolase [Blastocatellia bacterium]
MKLAIFDIDGTLTDTSWVDHRCFERALAAIGMPSLEADWIGCQHISDTGLTQHLYQACHARHPHDHEEATLREHFVSFLLEQHAQDEALFAEIAGAAAMLVQLAEKRDWVIAMATGCWRASAEMKLRAAGIALHEKPGGFAEDGPARESIVSTAIRRASEHYDHASFDKIVSIGDGLWDVRTAANLGLPFVGIATDARAEMLCSNGARHVVPNFADCAQFFAALEAAELPRQSLSAVQ